MANTAVEAIYKTVKDEYAGSYFVRYPYVFDEPGMPYIYMYEVSDPRVKAFLCDDSGGESRMTFGFLHTEFDKCVDILETILTFVNSLYGTYSPVTIWKVQIEGVRDLTGIEQGQEKVYRREFDALFSWSK